MSTKFLSALMKYWRMQRGMSQLDLALAAEVSARHISFMETGRASPSESMLLRIMRVLTVSLQDQNHALEAAGFAPRDLAMELDGIDPEADAAIARMVQSHGPYPLTVMDAGYDIVRCNPAAKRIFSQFVAEPHRLDAPLNLFDLVFDPGLGRLFIHNWMLVGQQMVCRLHREALLCPETDVLWRLLERVLSYPDVPKPWRAPDFSLRQAPINQLVLQNDTLQLGFTMVVTTFLASQHTTLDGLRIESYFPIDDATRRACEALELGGTLPVTV
jgi:transcriptional regulator with XRE-family HTH domain